MLVERYDTAPINQLNFDSLTGFLIAKNVPIARAGVFSYRKADGSFLMEAKLPEELLSDDTVATVNCKPITDNHPRENGENVLVNRGNSAKYMKGLTASNAHVDSSDNTLRVDMTISDPELIKEVQNGKEELSIGFQTEVEPRKGTYKGMAFDAVQKNIQVNHVAIVDRGRAGHTVRLTGDSAESVIDDNRERTNEQMETTKVRLDGENITVATDDADKVTKSNSSLASLKEQLKAEQAKVADLEAKVKKAERDAADKKKKADTAQAKADSAEKDKIELQTKLDKFKTDSVDELVNNRLQLIDTARTLVGDGYDFNGKNEKTIKVDSIKAVDSNFDEKDKSDDYINAYFDSQVKNATKGRVIGSPSFKGDNGDELGVNPWADLYNKEAR